MSEPVEIFSADKMRRTINRIASQIVERSDLSRLALIGIYTRGVPLAATLAKQIELLSTLR